jgi:hypothetical protein
VSIRWMTHVWDKSPYEGARLLIHLGMADHANETGWFFISQTSLAKKSRCSVEYVRQTVAKMISDCCVEIVKKGHSRGRATEYRLLKLPNSVGANENNDPPTIDVELHNFGPLLPNFASEQPSYTTLKDTTLETVKPSLTAAKKWWENQNPRPLGKGAWFALVKVCEAAEARGYTEEQIMTALNQIGVVPSMQQMDKALRNVRPMSARQERLNRGLSNVITLNQNKNPIWELE